jgi:hypothetical protein
MKISPQSLFALSLLLASLLTGDAFQAGGWTRSRSVIGPLSESEATTPTTTTSSQSTPPISPIQEASQLLSDWDKHYNADVSAEPSADLKIMRESLIDAVRLLNEAATAERDQDGTKGRCMLGICASSTQEGIATLKSWVTSLELPRGLLHGMDKDGVPLEIEGGAYIKYNTGGSSTFSAIKKSGVGFDALWKPGDAMLESYDGVYRGVYFQVELTDGEFRQYMLPLDSFMDQS